MKFPQRTLTHKIEASSWRILQSTAPDEWIIREVSERDYGVDCYIEITTSTGAVTGQLVSVQLKGVEKLEWNDDGNGKRITRSPQIKTSSARYWLGLPVPVFLFVADLSEEQVYFIAVDSEIRKQFGKLSKQDSITFELKDTLNIATEAGRIIFNWLALRERAHEQIASHITNLISHIQPFGEFISINQGRDLFMEVESDRHLQFRAIYETCQAASFLLTSEWKVESLETLYSSDKEQWKDPYVVLHEGTLDRALSQLEKIFLPTVRAALELVTIKQSDYWRTRDPVLHRLCQSGEIDWSIKQVEALFQGS